MRIATKVRLCPSCRSLLVGLVRTVECVGGPPGWRKPEQTEWLCESCDTEWVCMHGKGLVLAEIAEREAEAEEADECCEEIA